MFINEIEYHNPTSVDALLACLDQYGEDGKLLAGGTDLILQMKFKRWSQQHIINVKSIPELKKIETSDSYLEIGCNTTLSELLDHDGVKSLYPALWQAIYELADRQIRNRGTLVGNVCNASPAADANTALLIYHSEVHIQSSADSKIVPISEFWLGPSKTILKPNEFVRAIRLPLPGERAFSSFQKLGRTYDDIAIINAAASVELDEAGQCTGARIAMGAVGPTTLQAPLASAHLLGKRLDKTVIEEAAKMASDEASPITDVRASATYRRKMVRVLVARALHDIVLRSEEN
ncbi:FAD binding domain-containing protein [Halalkalibacter oceani]|uniref:FAD binding domain-containing protein n=1 Tax=Halalkalibacter oceani TaxID=1653776 RepID=UPI00339B53AC